MKKWAVLFMIFASFSRSFAESHERIYTGYIPQFETFAETMLEKLNETCGTQKTGCSANQECEIIFDGDPFYGPGANAFAFDKSPEKEKIIQPETYRLRFKNTCNSKTLEFEWQNELLDQDKGRSIVTVNGNEMSDRKGSFKNLESYLSAIIKNKNWFDWASDIAKEANNWVTY